MLNVGNMKIHLFVLFVLFLPTLQQGFYSVVAPKYIRPHVDYKVAISNHDEVYPMEALVKISGYSDAGAGFRNERQITLLPSETKVVKVQIGELERGTYTLSVDGRGNQRTFFNTTSLIYDAKSFSVFIQTDKAVYEPGETVKFRAIIVNSLLKPTVTGAIDVTVFDGESNRVKHWGRVFTKNGIFSDEFKLSREAVLGNWNVSVTVFSQLFDGSFTVAQYVLPKFDIQANVVEYTTFAAREVPVTISAKEVYGTAVKGELSVLIRAQPKTKYLQPVYTKPKIAIRKPIKGETDFNVEIDKLEVAENDETTVTMDITVVETNSQRSQNITKTFKLYKYPYYVEMYRTSNNFKPGLQYTTFLDIRQQDGQPVPGAVETVAVTYNYNNGPLVNTTHLIPESGIVKLDFLVPQTAKLLTIQATYRDKTVYFPPIAAAKSYSGHYLQASLLTSNPEVNREVKIQVNVTTDIQQFTYQVLGRGSLLFAQTIRLYGQSSHQFRFQCLPAMSPHAVLVVYATSTQGELLTDVLQFSVQGIFQNQVSVQPSITSGHPGQTVTFTVTSHPQSDIGITAVDTRSQYLGSQQAITESTVLNELDSYGNVYIPGGVPWWSSDWEHNQDIGVIVLTDSRQPPLSSSGLENNSFETATRPPLAGPFAFSRIPRPVGPRVYLSHAIAEPWLFEERSSGGSGKLTLTTTMPDGAHEWTITAFTLHPIFGFAVSSKPITIKSRQDVVIRMNLPTLVNAGELVQAEVVIVNNYNSNAQVLVGIEIFHGQESIETNEKSLFIDPQQTRSVLFPIKTEKTGTYTINATAASGRQTKVLSQAITIKDPGQPTYNTSVYLLDLSSGSLLENVTLKTPGSTRPPHITVSVTGDVLAAPLSDPTMSNLFPLPSGTGEQAAGQIITAAVLLDYLKKSNRYRRNKEKDIKDFTEALEQNYMKLLTFRRDDEGSFSQFGESDKEGSTWVTAYALKALNKARDHIYVDSLVIENAYDWLTSLQFADGSFRQVGNSPLSPGVELTAHVLLAYIDVKQYNFDNIVAKGLDMIAQSIPTEPAPLALVTYILTVTKHPMQNIAFASLDAVALNKDGVKYWPTGSESSRVCSPDINTASYALLSYSLRNLIDEARPIIRWLLKNRTPHGGFVTAQVTATATEALSTVTNLLLRRPAEAQIAFNFEDSRKRNFYITSDNQHEFQMYQLPTKSEYAYVDARGSGMLIISVYFVYSVDFTAAQPAFVLDPQVDKRSTIDFMQLSVCTGYLGNSRNPVAVMDVTLPSGYVVNEDSLPSIIKYETVKRVETFNKNKVSIYLSDMERLETCPTISAFRVYEVAIQHPVDVTVYNYYNTCETSRIFYRQTIYPIDGNIINTGSNTQTESSAMRDRAMGVFVILSCTLLLLR